MRGITSNMGMAVINGRMTRNKMLHGSTLRVLGAILEGKVRRNPPTVKELCVLIQASSPNAVTHHLRRLKKLGLIAWEVGKARTVLPTCTVELLDTARSPG